MAPNAPSMVPVVCERILVGPGPTAILQTPCQRGQDLSAWSQLYPEHERAPHGHSDAGEGGCCLVTGYLPHSGPVLGADSTAIVSRNCHSNPLPPPFSWRKPGEATGLRLIRQPPQVSVPLASPKMQIPASGSPSVTSEAIEPGRPDSNHRACPAWRAWVAVITEKWAPRFCDAQETRGLCCLSNGGPGSAESRGSCRANGGK